jgi:hypothetical protein
VRLALALALALRAGCPGGGGPPEPATCTSPALPAAPFSLDLGDAGGAWPDGKRVTLETGGQGFKMLPVMTYVSGASVPDCVQQDLDTRIAGQDAGGALYNLTLRRHPSGRYVSDTVYVVIFGSYPGAELTVTASIGSETVTRRYVVE